MQQLILRPCARRVPRLRTTFFAAATAAVRHGSGGGSGSGSSDALTDRWTIAHSRQPAADRRWPRPNSPLASFHESDASWAAAEEEEIALGTRAASQTLDTSLLFLCLSLINCV